MPAPPRVVKLERQIALARRNVHTGDRDLDGIAEREPAARSLPHQSHPRGVQLEAIVQLVAHRNESIDRWVVQLHETSPGHEPRDSTRYALPESPRHQPQALDLRRLALGVGGVLFAAAALSGERRGLVRVPRLVADALDPFAH